jgi:hypothetical protein
MNTNAPMSVPDNGGDAEDGILRLGAKGQFVIACNDDDFSATFEWTSQTDVGDI